MASATREFVVLDGRRDAATHAPPRTLHTSQMPTLVASAPVKFPLLADPASFGERPSTKLLPSLGDDDDDDDTKPVMTTGSSDASDGSSPRRTKGKRSKPSPASQAAAVRSGRAMTNAERGRAFRARRSNYMGEMEIEIYRLRAQIAELESVRTMWESTRVHAAPQNDTGALVRLIHEYFTLFRFGFRFAVDKGSSTSPPKRPSLVSPDVVRAKLSYQEHFLRRVMAPNASVGDGYGPEASISNWSGYTLAHGNQRIDIRHVAAIGADDHLVTEAHVTFNGKITDTTFRVLYPRALHRHDLRAVFLHRPVQFHAVFRHEFTREGQIQFEGVEIGFVDGLLATGAPLCDVMELLRLSIMSPAHTIADRIVELPVAEAVEPLDETSSSAASEDDSDAGHKLRMEYILGA